MQAEGSQIAGKQGHHGLAFRIAEAAVVLNDLGAVRGQHQPEVQEAAVGKAVFLQSGYGRGHDFLLNAFQHFRLYQLAGCHGAHAARIGAGVAFLEAFVIPRRAQDQVMVVHQGSEDGNLRSG